MQETEEMENFTKVPSQITGDKLDSSPEKLLSLY